MGIAGRFQPKASHRETMANLLSERQFLSKSYSSVDIPGRPPKIPDVSPDFDLLSAVYSAVTVHSGVDV
ncbi:hypothetical protein N7488_010323 [Penicillium malachiteum]|nr:hypothetical protein N7488_010323 [Penicillium malachiteum]